MIMGKQSSIGPIDPQFCGVSTYAVIEEFTRALKELKQDPSTIPIWQVIILKYHPTFIGECEKAKEWASKIVQQWLQFSMFQTDENAAEIAGKIVNGLSYHETTKSHSRHINSEEAAELGLKITPLEKDAQIQDCVLTIHHAYMHTFSHSAAHKIVENHEGKAIIFSSQQIPPFNIMPQPPQEPL
jgi:hypothetical protein